MERRRFIAGLTALGAVSTLGPLGLSSCGGATKVQAKEARGSAARATPGAEASTSAAALARANAAFGWDLYGRLAAAEKGNVFLSPYSIGAAMAMVHAGAMGETKAGIAKALRFDAVQGDVNAAFNALDQGLVPAAPSGQTQPFELTVANSSWVQSGFALQPAYLDALSRYFGAGIWQADFHKDPEGGRKAVNDWVLDKTRQRIKDLLPPGSVTSLTRLVLANAIYFKADWLVTFKKESTSNRPFTPLAGAAKDVPTMQQTGTFAYAEGDGIEALEMPYVGGTTSMVILLPVHGGLSDLEGQAQAVADQLIPQLQAARVAVTLPKWEFNAEFSLASALAALGADAAFDARRADLSGIDGKRDLAVTGVYHKAYVRVDEKGTEAAAATGAVVGATSAPVAPPIAFTADHPFLFLIRDRKTNALLFAGRVVDPAA
jgi:serpin B